MVFRGARNGGCSKFHPKICEQIKDGMKVCNIPDCQFTHPPVCETFTDTKVVCEKQNCLKQHRAISDWHYEKIPYFHDEGCWDKFTWRKLSKKLKKMWQDRKLKEEGLLQKKNIKGG